jgi:hypothetical protein
MSRKHQHHSSPYDVTRLRTFLTNDPADPTPESKLWMNDRGALVEEYDGGGDGPPKRSFKIRRLGFTATERDRIKASLLIREELRREGWNEGPDDPDDKRRKDFDDEVTRRLKDLDYSWVPGLLKQYEKLMQISKAPDRKPIRDHIEAKAIRRIPEFEELEEKLMHCGFGRPSDRRMQMATFLRMALGDCPPEIRKTLKEFEGSNSELDWAYVDETDPEKVKPLLRDETALRRTMKAMLERNDPELAWLLNAALLGRFHQRYPDVGRYLSVDATMIEAHLEQTGNLSSEMAKFLDRGTGAKFGHHGGRNRKPKSWRGWKLLLLVDLKTGLVLVGMLIPANAPEYPYIPELLDKAFRLMPWLDPEYLVADSEMDRKTHLAFKLQERYGITPVFDLRENVSRDFEWAESEGVPKCSKHGHMHLEQVELDPYRAVPITDTRDPETAKREYKGRMRWICKDCETEGVKIRTETWVRHNARIYTALPRQGDNWRAALRQALMLRRNHSESCNSQIKIRGIGGRNHFKARWVTKQAHMEWLTYMAAVAPTLRREAHESGLYAQMVEEAERLKLVKKKLDLPETSECSVIEFPDAGGAGWRSRKAA